MRIRRRDDVLWRRLPDRVLVLPEDGSLRTLPPPTSEIWELLGDGARTTDELVAALADRYAGSVEEIAVGVSDAVAVLVEAGVLAPA